MHCILSMAFWFANCLAPCPPVLLHDAGPPWKYFPVFTLTAIGEAWWHSFRDG